MRHSTHARWAGPALPEPPTYETGPVARNSDQAPDEQESTDTPGSAAIDAKRKTFATLTARLALVGLQLHRLDDNTLLVTHTSQARVFADERSVALFAEELGVES
ncbi:MAG: hypothetical protein AB7O64_14135 [Methylibium sp.]